MKAAILHKIGAPLAIEDAEIDDPRDNEVLVRTAASGVCHSDWHNIIGDSPMPLPALLGHEAAGVVEAVGSDVTYVKPGDHVIARGSFCGACEMCLRGHANLCPIKPGRDLDLKPWRISLRGERLNTSQSNISSFAEQMLLHENGLVKIREDIPLDVAALVGCGVMTGVGAALRTAAVEPGSTVAVFGLGGIGLSVVQGARIAGALRIIAVDLIDEKLDIAREFGATDTVNGKTEDPVAAIRALTGDGVDYSFDAIGLASVVVQAVQVLRPRGTATMIGVIPDGQKIELDWRMLGGEKKVQSCNMGSTRFRIDMPMLLDLYSQGRLMIDEMITLRGPLDDINEMFDAMAGARSPDRSSCSDRQPDRQLPRRSPPPRGFAHIEADRGAVSDERSSA